MLFLIQKNFNFLLKNVIIMLTVYKKGEFMNYSLLIKKLRNVLLISQSELAKLLGTNKVTVSRWENGKFEPNYKYKRQLVVLFNEHLPEEVRVHV